MRAALLSMILCLSVSTVQADTVTLVADEWCPYNCTPGAANPGILIEVAKYALEKAGHTVQYSNVPWARAIEDARSGKYSGIVGAYKDDAPDFVFPEQAVMSSSNDFFVKSGSAWKYTDAASLGSVSLAVIRDYSYSSDLDKYIEANQSNPDKVQLASGDDALTKNIEKLLAGRVGTVIEDGAVMAYQLKEMGKVSDVAHAGTAGGDDVYVAFSPKSPNAAAYAKLVGDAIVELRANGKLEEIKKKYQ